MVFTKNNVNYDIIDDKNARVETLIDYDADEVNQNSSSLGTIIKKLSLKSVKQIKQDISSARDSNMSECIKQIIFYSIFFYISK